jgi:hypothetical protein
MYLKQNPENSRYTLSKAIILQQKSDTPTPSRERTPPVASRRTPPPICEPLHDTLDREEPIRRFDLPPRMRLMMMLEKAQLTTPSGFDMDGFLKRVMDVKMGQYKLRRGDDKRGVPQDFFRIFDDKGVEFVFTAVPEDVTLMNTIGKVFFTIGEKLYCLMPMKDI